MDYTVPMPTSLEQVSFMIRSALPSSWPAPFFAYDPRSRTLGVVTSLLALVLPCLLLHALHRYRRMHDRHGKPFPFMDLPQELRDMVYENLMENPVYPPPPPPCTRHTSSLWILPTRHQLPTTRKPHKSNWILLANKQVYREYMDMLCKKASFHLTVSPHNYHPQPSSPPLPSDATPALDNTVWTISLDTLKNLRTASLKLITTSTMLGVTDPRNMTSTDWVLARQIREQLKHLSSVTSLKLDAKAIGDPLWNPLWIWYHASQSFKAMGTAASDTIPIGPKLDRITFSLDTWSPGENFLERDEANKGAWTWFCMKGHNVGLDVGPEMTVREFCGKLYQECKVCRPEPDDEGEDVFGEE